MGILSPHGHLFPQEQSCSFITETSKMPAYLQVCFNFGTAKPVKLKVFFAHEACLHPRKRVGELVISILN